jgi:hypothetical protein
VAGSDIDLTAQDRLNAYLWGLIKKLHRTKHISMIRNRYGFHTKIFGLFQQLSDSDRAV